MAEFADVLGGESKVLGGKSKVHTGAKSSITRDRRTPFVLFALINIDSKLILWVWLLG